MYYPYFPRRHFYGGYGGFGYPYPGGYNGINQSIYNSGYMNNVYQNAYNSGYGYGWPYY